MLLYLFRSFCNHCTDLYEKGRDRDYISQDTCLKLLPVITRNDKWRGRLFGFVYLFFGTQNESFPEFRDIAVAEGIVEKMIIIYGCDIFQGIASVFLLRG